MMVSVTTTPADVLAAAGIVGHRRALVLNNGSETVFLGHTVEEATSAQGLPLKAGAAIEFSEPLRKYTGGTELFASCVTGPVELRILAV